MTTGEYVAVESAGHLTGIPARTLRRWIADGKLPATKAGRKNLVSLRDVERVAAIAGRPVGHDRPADDLTGHVATATAGHADDEPTVIEATGHTSGIAPAARSQLEAIRDEWLRPLIDELNAKSEEIGTLRAERDALRWERDRLAEQAPAERASWDELMRTTAERDTLKEEVARLRAGQDAPEKSLKNRGEAIASDPTSETLRESARPGPTGEATRAPETEASQHRGSFVVSWVRRLFGGG